MTVYVIIIHTPAFGQSYEYMSNTNGISASHQNNNLKMLIDPNMITAYHGQQDFITKQDFVAASTLVKIAQFSCVPRKHEKVIL